MFSRLQDSTQSVHGEARSHTSDEPKSDCGPRCECLEERRLFSATLTGSFAGSLPLSLLPSADDQVTFRLTNTGDATARGMSTVSLYASTDQTINANADLLAIITRPVLLRPGRSTALSLRFPTPAILAGGNYFLVARVDAPVNSDGSVVEAVVDSSRAVAIPEPFVDLTGRIAIQSIVPLVVVASRTTTGIENVLVINRGNAPARGPLDITLFASTDKTLDSADTQIAAAHFNNVNIRAGGSRLFAVPLTLAGDTPVGSYTLFASINSSNTIAESNLANNVAMAGKPLVLINPPPIVDQRDHHHDQNNGDGAGFVGVDLTMIDNGSDSFDMGDVPDMSFPPPDVAPAATAPMDSTDTGNPSDFTGADLTVGDFGGDFSGDVGGGADF